MDKMFIFTLLLLLCVESYAISWNKNENPRKYFGIEIGEGDSSGQNLDEDEFDDVDSRLADNISFSRSYMVKVNYGSYYATIDDIWSGPYDFIWEHSFTYLPTMDYEVSPYLEVKRSLYMFSTSAKISRKWWALGMSVGAFVGEMRLRENSDPSVTTGHDLKAEKYINGFHILHFELKHMLSEKYQLLLGFNHIRWLKDHDVAVTLDKRGSVPYSINVYSLPDGHQLNAIYLGLNYFLDR